MFDKVHQHIAQKIPYSHYWEMGQSKQAKKSKTILDFTMNRDFFIFYSSFYDAISELDDATQLALYKAIAEFALFYTEPELTGVANAVWKAIRPNLASNWNKYMNGCKGGCPKGTKKPTMIGNQNAKIKTESKPNQNQNETKSKAINNKQETNNKKQETNNIDSSSISDGRNCVQKDFAPGCGDDFCFRVFDLYNRIIGRRPLEPKNLTTNRRDAISEQYKRLNGDLNRFKSVFQAIAKNKDSEISHPYFDSIFFNKIYNPFWNNA